MKLIAEVTGHQHELTLERDAAEPSHVVATIDGRRYEIIAREITTGFYLLLNEARVYKCRVDKTGIQSTGGAEVYVGNQTYGVTIIDPKRMRSGQHVGAHGVDGSAQIVAPMPGKIVRVLIEQGASVEAGDSLIVVEAMKMQNEMKAPRAGVIAKLNAQAGATVNAGDVLAVIE